MISIVFTHKSGYLIFVKSFKKSKKDKKPIVEYHSESLCYEFDSSGVNSLENNLWVSCLTDKATKNPLSEEIDEYLLKNKTTGDHDEFKPSFSNVETIFNSCLLILLTIFTAVIACIVSPALILPSIKSFYCKIAKKSH